jgi:hypothetical protein
MFKVKEEPAPEFFTRAIRLINYYCTKKLRLPVGVKNEKTRDISCFDPFSRIF